MKNMYTFIWDLDGTLFDSYDSIVTSMQETLEERGVSKSYQEIMDYAILKSLGDYIKEMEKIYGFPAKEINDRCTQLRNDKMYEIPLMPHGKEVLQGLKEAGAKHYIYTHRGSSTVPILKNLGIYEYFDEIITAEDGFQRKPAPDAVYYFIEKYHLKKEFTYYVGDRRIDMECAQNAGIGKVIYIPPQSVGKATGIEDYVIHDLNELLDIF